MYQIMMIVFTCLFFVAFLWLIIALIQGCSRRKKIGVKLKHRYLKYPSKYKDKYDDFSDR